MKNHRGGRSAFIGCILLLVCSGLWPEGRGLFYAVDLKQDLGLEFVWEYRWSGSFSLRLGAGTSLLLPHHLKEKELTVSLSAQFSYRYALASWYLGLSGGLCELVGVLYNDAAKKEEGLGLLFAPGMYLVGGRSLVRGMELGFALGASYPFFLDKGRWTLGEEGLLSPLRPAARVSLLLPF